MPKVVSGKGFDEFVQSGKHQVINDTKKPTEAPKVEPPPEVKEVIAKAEAESAQAIAPKAEEDSGLEAGDEDLAERAQQRIAKKHREMKQADALAKKLRAELDDTENFSKSQYQRAQLAEERAATLERELSELRSKAPKPETGLKPDHKDPKYYDAEGQFKAFEYAEDLSGYSATKAVDDDRKRQAEERSKAQQAEVAKAFDARIERAKEKYPDFKEVVGAADVAVPDYIKSYIVESDFGGDLGYYLAKYPEDRERIFKLSPIRAIAEIGKLEVQWEKKPEAKVTPEPPPKPSGAPAPITPLSGSSTGVNTDPAKMTPAELLRYTREREVARKRR